MFTTYKYTLTLLSMLFFVIIFWLYNATLQGIPRTVVLDTKTGSNLLQWPVEEVESLRLKSNDFNSMEMKAGSVVPLELDGATQVCMCVISRTKL